VKIVERFSGNPQAGAWRAQQFRLEVFTQGSMPINHHEIIEEIEAHIPKFGGELSEWCGGTAKDARGPFFRQYFAEDLGDGLAYRKRSYQPSVFSRQ
jgi:hypothetical protein